MLVHEHYAKEKTLKTPERKFPVHVTVEETRWKFKVIFTDNHDIAHPSEWLWKGKLMDNRNQLAIDKVLETADEAIQRRLQQSINRDLWEAGKERRIEAKVDRIMSRY